MNPIINKILSYFKVSKIPEEFIEQYNRNLFQISKNPGEFAIYKRLRYDAGSHPKSYIDYECEFAARHLNKSSHQLRWEDKLNPAKILDIGSYRHFIIGLLSHSRVTTVDVRARESILPSETIVAGDAKKLDLPDNEFDAVLSLCTLEHMGLGRYGDEFDLEADKKAFAEMIRVLKPNGHLIFSTHITCAQPSLVFNAHRIYSYEMLRAFCGNLICIEEKFYSHKLKSLCALAELTKKPGVWDVYLGCWRKN